MFIVIKYIYNFDCYTVRYSKIKVSHNNSFPKKMPENFYVQHPSKKESYSAICEQLIKLHKKQLGLANGERLTVCRVLLIVKKYFFKYFL